MERGKFIFLFMLILILSFPVVWAHTTPTRTSSSRTLRGETTIDENGAGNHRMLQPSKIEELYRALKAYSNLDLNNRV